MHRVSSLALAFSLAGLSACGHSEPQHEPLLTDYASPSERYVADVRPAASRESASAPAVAHESGAATRSPADSPSDDAFAAAMEQELSRAPAEPAPLATDGMPAATDSEAVAATSQVTDSRPATLEVRARGKARGSCRVVVGAQTIGKLPRATTQVAPGEHRVEVVCKDRRRFVETLLLAPGDTAKLVVAPSDLKREKKAAKRARR